MSPTGWFTISEPRAVQGDGEMAKKIKKFSDGTSRRRGSEKFRRAAFQFDKAMIACALVIIRSAVVALCGDFSLRTPSVNGFAVNFLWLLACLPLLIADGIASCFGWQIPAEGVQYIYILGICDLVLASAVWGAVRFAAMKKQNNSILKTARVLVLIILVWGIFQLFCSGLKFTLDRSNIDDAVTAQVTSDRK